MKTQRTAKPKAPEPKRIATPDAKVKRVSKRGVINEGRPPLYDDPVKLATEIVSYFNHCDNRIRTKVDAEGNGSSFVVPEPYTIAGLASYLGFEDRDALLYYQAKPAFSGIIKKARIKIESDVERRLFEGGATTGAIFWLKNHAGYTDKTETDHRVLEFRDYDASKGSPNEDKASAGVDT